MTERHLVQRAIGSAHAAKLPAYVHDHSHWIIEVPIRIIAIIVIAAIVRLVSHRFIDRLVRPVRGETPRILRPFKERAEATKVFSSGLVSARRVQRAATIGTVLKSVISFTILLVAIMLILSELDVSLAPFLAGTSIVGVALGFGAQNIVKDFLAGMFIMLEDQFGVGDVIVADQTSGTQNTTGVVEIVGLRTTRLRGQDGVIYYLRNGELIRIGNRSQGSTETPT